LQYLVLLGFVFALMGAIITLIGRAAITSNGDPRGVSIQQHQASSQATQTSKLSHGQAFLKTHSILQEAFTEMSSDSVKTVVLNVHTL